MKIDVGKTVALVSAHVQVLTYMHLCTKCVGDIGKTLVLLRTGHYVLVCMRSCMHT